MNLRARLVIALVGVLTACASTADPSPTFSTAQPGVREPSPSATSALTPPANASAPAEATNPGAAGPAFQMWQNWSLATVRVDDLNVRTGPSLSDPPLPDETGLETNGVVRLDAGDHVLVMGGELAHGAQWVQVGVQQGPQRPVVGWAAAGTLDDPWIESDNSWCPGVGPTLETLLDLTGIERMGCYASAPVSFTARQATIHPDAGLGGLCVDQVVPWLQCDNINYSWVNRDGGHDWEFLLHFDPVTGLAETGLANPGESRLLSITGHFMDEQATSCGPNPFVTDEDVARYLRCSTLFVVETIE